MKVKLETARLYLREFTLADAVLLYEMHQDPEITRYTGDPVPWSSVEQAEKIITDIILPQYKKGIGRWAAHLKENNEFIGWCGLKDLGGEVDLGYRYLQKYWGKGYATEAAKAVLQYGIDKKISNIIGRANKENRASVKVLEKIGLTFDSNYTDEQTSVVSVRFIYKD